MAKTIGWAVMSLGAVLGMILIAREGRQRRRLLKDRPMLSDDDIFSFYGNEHFDEKILIGIWHEIACNLKVEAGKLRPDDDLSKMRIPTLGWEDDLDYLSYWAGSQLTKDEPKPPMLKTMDELVRFAYRIRKRDSDGKRHG